MKNRFLPFLATIEQRFLVFFLYTTWRSTLSKVFTMSVPYSSPVTWILECGLLLLVFQSLFTSNVYIYQVTYCTLLNKLFCFVCSFYWDQNFNTHFAITVHIYTHSRKKGTPQVNSRLKIDRISDSYKSLRIKICNNLDRSIYVKT